MNVLRLIIILLVAGYISYEWDALCKQLGASNLITHMMTFMAVDYLTIWAISLYPVKNLTKTISIVLYVSILTHLYGAYCWTLYIDLSIYDQSKDWIFYMELLAFTAYGISGGCKRIRTLVNPSSMDDLSRVQGNSGADNSTQRVYRG